MQPREQVILVTSTVPAILPDQLYLSEEEILRASNFVNPEVKKAYQYQHHLLRQLLSNWLSSSHEKIEFSTNPFGKPTLKELPFFFNISRSGNELAFYFGPGEGGIDIETMKPSTPFKEIAIQHFHPSEQLNNLSDEAFFCIWTRKEALLKAMGVGLNAELQLLDTTLPILQAGGHLYELITYKQRTSIVSLSLPAAQFQTPVCFNA